MPGKVSILRHLVRTKFLGDAMIWSNVAIPGERETRRKVHPAFSGRFPLGLQEASLKANHPMDVLHRDLRLGPLDSTSAKANFRKLGL